MSGTIVATSFLAMYFTFGKQLFVRRSRRRRRRRRRRSREVRLDRTQMGGSGIEIVPARCIDDGELPPTLHPSFLELIQVSECARVCALHRQVGLHAPVGTSNIYLNLLFRSLVRTRNLESGTFSPFHTMHHLKQGANLQVQYSAKR